MDGAGLTAAERPPPDPDSTGRSPPIPDAPDPPALLSALLFECLVSLEERGVDGVCAVLREHPAQARALLRRLHLLARLGLLPDAPRPAS